MVLVFIQLAQKSKRTIGLNAKSNRRITELKVYELFDQMLFHTEKAQSVAQ